MAEIQRHIFKTQTVNLNYAEVPSSGAPLVLLHGGSARWQAFENIIMDLSHYHLYLPDLRGHGESGRATGHYRLQDYTNDIIKFIKDIIDQPVHLFGHSLGGIIALLVASQFTDGVRDVAVGDSPLSSQSWHRVMFNQTTDRVRAWQKISGGHIPIEQLIEILKDSPTEEPGNPNLVSMRSVFGEDSPVFSWLAENLYHQDPDMLSAILDRFDDTVAGYEMELVLPKIKCRTLLLQADPTTGGLMTDKEVQQALPLLSKPFHIKLEKLSHTLHNERKEPVIAALKQFFK
jgi:pimeloyl-ACP methyl ester carboxylesterase